VKKLILFSALILSSGCVCMTAERYKRDLKLAERCGRLEVFEEYHRLSHEALSQDERDWLLKSKIDGYLFQAGRMIRADFATDIEK